MPSDRKKLPGALLLLLSALGVLFGLAAAFFTLSSFSGEDNGMSFFTADALPVLSSGMLALFTGLLNLPTLVLSIHYLRGKPIAARHDALFKPATFFLLLWAAVIGAGYLAARSPQATPLLAALTVIAVSIPVWWLVEFSRRGLPRSLALREWGTLTVGLGAAPLVIMAVEILLVILIGIGVFIALSTQPGALAQLGEILQNLQLYQGSLEELEKSLYPLAKNPVVAGALFLVIGIVAPFIEELFKPMAIWFLLKRPLKNHEGFSLGLISGGAFALLESAGLIGQIAADTWLTAVALRSATGLLHIGLSGMVGYGLARAWNRKTFPRVLLTLLAAGSLHGAWNSMALLSGLSTSALPGAAADFQPTPGNILPAAGMLAVFCAVVFIVLRINRDLRRQAYEEAEAHEVAPTE